MNEDSWHHSIRNVLLGFLATVLVLWGTIGVCGTVPRMDPPTICDDAAIIAGRKHGVPEKLLLALNRTETGRMKNGTFMPWPWTVNSDGKGTWFDDRNQAVAFAHEAIGAGKTSFDVGCFQLNYRWHGSHFQSIEHMFDPMENADYAARFVKDLYLEKGNWLDAAAAYHSRTPGYATKYKTRFERILARLGDSDLSRQPNFGRTEGPSGTTGRGNEVNSFPLLVGLSDSTSRHGSLFPAGTVLAGRPILSNSSWFINK